MSCFLQGSSMTFPLCTRACARANFSTSTDFSTDTFDLDLSCCYAKHTLQLQQRTLNHKHENVELYYSLFPAWHCHVSSCYLHTCHNRTDHVQRYFLRELHALQATPCHHTWSPLDMKNVEYSSTLSPALHSNCRQVNFPFADRSIRQAISPFSGDGGINFRNFCSYIQTPVEAVHNWVRSYLSVFARSSTPFDLCSLPLPQPQSCNVSSGISSFHLPHLSSPLCSFCSLFWAFSLTCFLCSFHSLSVWLLFFSDLVFFVSLFLCWQHVSTCCPLLITAAFHF